MVGSGVAYGTGSGVVYGTGSGVAYGTVKLLELLTVCVDDS